MQVVGAGVVQLNYLLWNLHIDGFGILATITELEDRGSRCPSMNVGGRLENVPYTISAYQDLIS